MSMDRAVTCRHESDGWSRRCVRTSKQDPRVPTDAWGTHRAPAFARLRATRLVRADSASGVRSDRSRASKRTKARASCPERHGLIPAMTFKGKNKYLLL